MIDLQLGFIPSHSEIPLAPHQLICPRQNGLQVIEGRKLVISNRLDEKTFIQNFIDNIRSPGWGMISKFQDIKDYATALRQDHNTEKPFVITHSTDQLITKLELLGLRHKRLHQSLVFRFLEQIISIKTFLTTSSRTHKLVQLLHIVQLTCFSHQQGQNGKKYDYHSHYLHLWKRWHEARTMMLVDFRESWTWRALTLDLRLSKELFIVLIHIYVFGLKGL